MKRAALYARFSTDLQSDRSATDQNRQCREYCLKEQFIVVTEQKDEAKSGATSIGRRGLQKIVEMAENNEFDYLVVESVDRISRDMADAAYIKKTLEFFEIEIIAINQGSGPIDSFLYSIHSAIGQQGREETVKKVRRGMSQRARDGLHMGGKIYGFKPDPTKRGQLLIDSKESAVVVRIYSEYSDSKTPREIARGLNREFIIGPRGGTWNASTINGSSKRMNGILQNPIYKGDLIWGKCRMVRNPKTGKRVSRRQEPTTVVTAAIPQIVSAELWERVNNLRKQKTLAGSDRLPGPKRALSGLLKCHACGSGLSSRGMDKTGKTRIHCSRHAEGGICPKPQTFYLESIETEVFRVLEGILSKPEMIKLFVDVYNSEMALMEGDISNEINQLNGRQEFIDQRCRRLNNMILEEIGDPKSITENINELRAEYQENAQKLAELAENTQTRYQPNPQLGDQYQNLAETLKAHLIGATGVPTEAIREIRGLISRVVVKRDAGRQMIVQAFGLINALALPTPSGGQVVAGEGLEPPTPGL